MELYERVLYLEGVFGSRRAIAESLHITPQKLSAYSNTTSQKNLWEHLPKLLAARKSISRNWLYFGEGPMLMQDAPSCSGDFSDDERQGYLDTIRNLSETNRKLTDTNRQLTEELIRIRST